MRKIETIFKSGSLANDGKSLTVENEGHRLTLTLRVDHYHTVDTMTFHLTPAEVAQLEDALWAAKLEGRAA